MLSFDKRTGHIWLNGNMTNWPDAKIHVLTHGLHYASCVFEGIRVYGGKIFKLDQHHERIHRSAEYLDFKIPFNVKDLNNASQQLIKSNQIESGYIRTFAWRGSEQVSVSAPNTKIHTAIAAWETPKDYFTTLNSVNKGAKLVTSNWARPAPNTAPTQSKCASNYAISTLSKHQAIRQGYDDALLLDHRGFICEASAANIFFVINGDLHTPTTYSALSGITRQTIIDIAKQHGIKTIVRDIDPTEIGAASEVFLTGTACEILPVSSIDEYKFKPSAITHKLSQNYMALVQCHDLMETSNDLS